jgi:hypothetical protein
MFMDDHFAKEETAKESIENIVSTRELSRAGNTIVKSSSPPDSDSTPVDEVTIPTRPHSLPGAFRVHHPDAAQNTARDELRDDNILDNNNAEGAADLYIVPTAFPVDEQAAVTYSTDIVEASLMDINTQEGSNQPLAYHAVVLKRKHARLCALLVAVLMSSLLAALLVTISEDPTDKNSGNTEVLNAVLVPTLSPTYLRIPSPERNDSNGSESGSKEKERNPNGGGNDGGGGGRNGGSRPGDGRKRQLSVATGLHFGRQVRTAIKYQVPS